jgi:hypothetical protein
MTYKGFEVLQLNYNRTGHVDEQLDRKFTLLRSKTGSRVIDDQAPAPNPMRPFTWTAMGLQEIATMREFLAQRRGRAIPFWLPSFQWDLALAEDVPQNQSSATIVHVRYKQQMWNATGARRHLAIWSLGSTDMDLCQITAATDPGDNLTEILTLDPVASRTYDRNSTVLSFLKFCRLEDDQTEIRYLSPTVAESVIRVRELPLEAPL